MQNRGEQLEVLNIWIVLRSESLCNLLYSWKLSISFYKPPLAAQVVSFIGGRVANPCYLLDEQRLDRKLEGRMTLYTPQELDGSPQQLLCIESTSEYSTKPSSSFRLYPPKTISRRATTLCYPCNPIISRGGDSSRPWPPCPTTWHPWSRKSSWFKVLEVFSRTSQVMLVIDMTIFSTLFIL